MVTDTGGWEWEAHYNTDAEAMGGRWRHPRTGFLLDLLTIDGVPQAYLWVATPPDSDRGEPHTQEHLLLGKGNQGRRVALLEDMALVSSSAFTARDHTAYHFCTVAGPETFFRVLQARLEALIHPDYTDEEIRREVHHLGVRTAPDGTRCLEDKGTIYAEMVTTSARPGFRLWRAADQALWGEGHPMAASSGGLPAAIRTLQPHHIRQFHRRHYTLGNMGAIVTLPRTVPVAEALARLDALIGGLATDDGPGPVGPLPPPRPRADRDPVDVPWPEADPTTPTQILISWPGTDRPPREGILLDLLLATLAGAADSTLYRSLIDRTTRVRDLGATSVGAWTDDRQGQPVHFGIGGIAPDRLPPSEVLWLRDHVIEALQRIASADPTGSEHRRRLGQLHDQLVQWRRRLRAWVGTPPGFGERGTHDGLKRHLDELAVVGGQRRGLALEGPLAWVQGQLDRTTVNIFADWLPRWGLVGTTPLVHVTRPSPEALEALAAQRRIQLDRALADQLTRWGTSDPQEALARLAQAYDDATAEIEAGRIDARVPLVDDPPLTQDDPSLLQISLIGGVELASGRFESMAGAEIGLLFDLDGLPPDLAWLLAGLPALLTGTGVRLDGRSLTPSDVLEALRRGVLGVGASWVRDAPTGAGGAVDVGQRHRRRRVQHRADLDAPVPVAARLAARQPAADPRRGGPPAHRQPPGHPAARGALGAPRRDRVALRRRSDRANLDVPDPGVRSAAAAVGADRSRSGDPGRPRRGGDGHRRSRVDPPLPGRRRPPAGSGR